MIFRLLTLAGWFALGQITMMSQKDPSFKTDMSKAQWLDKLSVIRNHLTSTNKTRVDEVKIFVDKHDIIKDSLHAIENNIWSLQKKWIDELEADAHAMYTYIQKKTSDWWHDIDSRYNITTTFHTLLADVQRIKEKQQEEQQEEKEQEHPITKKKSTKSEGV